MAEPTLHLIQPSSASQGEGGSIHNREAPKISKRSPIGVGDVFTEDQQKKIFAQAVDALAEIALTGNDNARTGAAAKLVDLFKATAQAGQKKRVVRVNWRNPLDEAPEDAQGVGVDDLLA